MTALSGPSPRPSAFAFTRPDTPAAFPCRSAMDPARVRVTFRPGHPDAGLSLHQLQDTFDGEAAHLTVRRLRVPGRTVPQIDGPAEARWLALALPLALLAFTLVAAVLP